MEENEYIDEVGDEYDQAQDISDGQLAAYEYGTIPQAKDQHNLYTWFWKVVRLGKVAEKGEEGFSDESLRLAKVGNLNMQEIGQFNTSVRDCLNLANLGKIFNHSKFGDYWQSVAMITSATSMAKKGWFMDLSISQRKIRERAKAKSSFEGKQKWRLFSGKKESSE